MGHRRIDTLSQIRGQRLWIKVMCRCGNNALLDPDRLMVRYGLSGKTTVHQLFGRLRCKLCRQRPYDVFAMFKPET